MRINTVQWQTTSIGSIIDIFTGRLSEKLASCDPKFFPPLKKYIYAIFRRWYFTSLAPIEDITPCGRIDYFKEIEHWPTDGQFLFKPDMFYSTKTKKVEISVDVDFIDFLQQPLFTSMQQIQQEKKVNFLTQEEDYHQIIHTLAKDAPLISNASLVNVKQIWLDYITYFCAAWRKADPFIEQGCSLNRLMSLYKQFLRDAGAREDGLSVDDTVDMIVLTVRKTFPGWALTTTELEEKEATLIELKKDPFTDMQVHTFFFLGLFFDKYFLTPLTSYLQLLESYYTDALSWDEDFLRFLQNGGKSELEFLKPPSSFRLTTFGKQFVKGFIL
jgi:hypothetical protein